MKTIRNVAVLSLIFFLWQACSPQDKGVDWVKQQVVNRLQTPLFSSPSASPPPPSSSLQATQSSERHKITVDSTQVKLEERRPRARDCRIPPYPSFKRTERTLDIGMFALDIYSDQLSQEFLTHLKRQISHMERVYRSLFSLESLPIVQVKMVILADPQAFEQYAQKSTGQHQMAGSFNSRTGTVLVRDFGDQRTLQIAVHELVHAVNHALFGFTPGWLNEGMAEYFANLYLQPNGQLTRSDEEWVDEHGQLRFSPYDLPQLLGQENYWYKDAYQESIRLYGSSWLFVDFLMSNQQGREAVQRLLIKEAERTCTTLDDGDMLQRVIDLYPSVETDFLEWRQRQFS